MLIQTGFDEQGQLIIWIHTAGKKVPKTAYLCAPFRTEGKWKEVLKRQKLQSQKVK